MYPNLEAELARNNITQINVSEVLNIRTSTTSDKMNGKTDFKLRECKKIKTTYFPNLGIEYLFATKDELLGKEDDKNESWCRRGSKTDEYEE